LLALLGLGAVLSCTVGRWWYRNTYLGFTLRSRGYYAPIAAACEEVFNQNSTNFLGEVKFLRPCTNVPAALRSLDPAYVVVNRIGVLVLIRAEAGPFFIGWHRAVDDPWFLQSHPAELRSDRWLLVARADGARRVLYSTNIAQPKWEK